MPIPNWPSLKEKLVTHGGKIGAGVFGSLGALHGARKRDENNKKRSTTARVAGGLGGALAGGLQGYILGDFPNIIRSLKLRRRKIPTATDSKSPLSEQLQTRANELARRYARKPSPVDGRPFFPNKSDMTKINSAQLYGFSDELDKIAIDLQEAAMAVPGLMAGARTGKSIARHTAAGTAPHGYKTRSEDIAKNIGTVTAPAGAIGGMALARKYGLGDAVAKRMMDHFPAGLIMNPQTERYLVRSGVVPAVAGMAGGALGGYLTGKGVGLAARLRDGRGPTEA